MRTQQMNNIYNMGDAPENNESKPSTLVSILKFIGLKRYTKDETDFMSVWKKIAIGLTRGVLILFAAMLIMIFMVNGGFYNGSSPKKKANPIDIFMAEDICEGFVKDRLKSPATASFLNQKTHVTDDGLFISKGQIDSQNSFAAVVRGYYDCRVNKTGNTWSLVNLEIN